MKTTLKDVDWSVASSRTIICSHLQTFPKIALGIKTGEFQGRKTFFYDNFW